MVYTDFANKVVLEAWGLAKLTLAAACVKGDMLYQDGNLADANSSPERQFDYVALAAGASGGVITVAKHALIRKPSTIGAGGVVTAGTHSGAADETLWLSATAGRPGSAAVATLAQIVGVCISSQDFILDSTKPRWSNAELITAAKTLDEQDTGKAMVCTVAAKVTLPAVAAGLHFTIVNGADDAVALIEVDPNANDEILGPDYAGTDDKDWQNTAATAICGDYLEIQGGATAGWAVTAIKGVWAQET